MMIMDATASGRLAGLVRVWNKVEDLLDSEYPSPARF